MKFLVSGFKPFLGESLNPSEKLSAELTELVSDVESCLLPVEFKNSFVVLKKKIEETKPDYLIMVGQASGRKNICLEKIALNWVQTEYNDESGFRPKTGQILKNIELALMSNFPIDQVFLELRKKKLPVEISFSAGTYVCNDLYLRILNSFKNLKAVFIHVPLLPEQLTEYDYRPAMKYEEQLEVIQQVIRCQALFHPSL